MSEFFQAAPSLADCWRAIIMFGKNSATFKFALAESVLELTGSGKTFFTLDELAEPFARNILKHLASAGRQGTSRSSQFIDSLRAYQQGAISKEQMLETTARKGFVNVIDAFHVVNQADIPIRFFIDERRSSNGIAITDEFLALKETFQARNLPLETEARWRLVETAWSIGISPSLLVQYGDADQSLFIQRNPLSRINITSCKDALNGYQKGKCFYCFKEIAVDDCDVDHFFPFILVRSAPYFAQVNLNGVWNLVLVCHECNRGEQGKFTRIPALKYRERLHRRNNYLIDSHHPLRETMMIQTGATEPLRRNFLLTTDALAIQSLIHRWSPADELDATF